MKKKNHEGRGEKSVFLCDRERLSGEKKTVKKKVKSTSCCKNESLALEENSNLLFFGKGRNLRALGNALLF